MILKDSFYRIKGFSNTEKGVNFFIEFNSEHFIYKAHFPDNPITPGVCIIHIIKELLIETGVPALLIKKIPQVKFLNIIQPSENKEVTFSISILSIENDTCKIGATVFCGNNIFAKLTMVIVNHHKFLPKHFKLYPIFTH
ncbi:MAG: hydroxymyristoyl-ACP dehydratase [Bacteroidales bacterium]|jgi:3-hydroxyacyl-[acyl-carrier-protein] dehydratase|nr:hydroxymyristoyl-ACP dehydratase [Bacteroidales bacterium]